MSHKGTCCLNDYYPCSRTDMKPKVESKVKNEESYFVVLLVNPKPSRFGDLLYRYPRKDKALDAGASFCDNGEQYFVVEVQSSGTVKCERYEKRCSYFKVQ